MVRLHLVFVLRPLREQVVRVHLLLHLLEVELVLVEVFPPWLDAEEARVLQLAVQCGEESLRHCYRLIPH